MLKTYGRYNNSLCIAQICKLKYFKYSQTNCAVLISIKHHLFKCVLHKDNKVIRNTPFKRVEINITLSL